MAAEHPTERTPLIEHTPTNTATITLPFILDLEKDIHSDPEYPAVDKIVDRKVDALSLASSISLTLKLILCLRFLSGAYLQLDKENWVDPRTVEKEVSDLVLQYWKDLQSSAFSQALLDEALWNQFPLDGEKEVSISLIGAILSDQSHGLSSMQLDDRIALSLLRTWKSGRPRSTNDDRQSTTILNRIEGFATPRVLHLVDLAFNLAYLTILVHYLMRPMLSFPAEQPPLPDYRFYCIALYAVTRILKGPWPSANHTTFFLTLATFLSVFPSMPRPHDNSFIVLLLCFFIHTIQLLPPCAPSIPLLRPQMISFPVSVMLGNLFSLVFFPALTFFIPIILALLYLLSASLNDIFVTAGDRLVAFDLFLFSVWCSGLLFTCLTVYMTLSSSSLPPVKSHHPDIPVGWNSYGPNISVSIRRRLCRLATGYSTPYFFPAPLNLIPLILVHLPRRVLLLFGEMHIAPYLTSTVEPVIWRILVMPLVFVFGIIWLRR